MVDLHAYSEMSRHSLAFPGKKKKKIQSRLFLSQFFLPSGRLVLLQGSQVPHNTVELKRKES